jgi:hypothetical protein
MKTCNRCKEEKELDCFSKQAKAKDGIRPYCKSCAAKAHQEGLVRIAEKRAHPSFIAPTEKCCSLCKKTKKAEEFSETFRTVDGLHSRCKSCINNIARERYKEDPVKLSEINRRAKYKAKYGLTVDDYDVLFAKQGGKCALCGIDNTGRENAKHFAIDHCHDTGVIRGLLCSPCNTALGLMKDNVDTMYNAIGYVLESRDEWLTQT